MSIVTPCVNIFEGRGPVTIRGSYCIIQYVVIIHNLAFEDDINWHYS